ncbi:hypothetical protein LLG95_06555 [bacterium]|nr:hypothetical protein [bacterium]
MAITIGMSTVTAITIAIGMIATITTGMTDMTAIIETGATIAIDRHSMDG